MAWDRPVGARTTTVGGRFVVLLVVLLAACGATPDGPAAPLAPAPPATTTAPTTTTTTTTTTTAPATTMTTATETTATTTTTTIETAPVVDRQAFATTGVTVPAERPLRVLVVGDSVAASLAGDTARQRFEVGDGGTVDVVNVGSAACPIILDGSWWFTDGSTLRANPTCDLPDRYDDDVAGFAPDVVLAVFGWPGVGGGQRFPDGTVAVPCEERFDAAWESGYRALVERLDPYTTVVVATVPPVAMDPRRIETRCLNDIVRALPAPVLDLEAWLCPGLDCSARAELRTDGVHFANEPSLRAAAMSGILGLLTAAAA